MHAQLRVDADGRAHIGKFPATAIVDADKVLTTQLFGPNGDYFAGSKLAFGDFGRREFGAWNVFVGEYRDEDTDELWLHGKNGISMTVNNGSTRIAYYYVATPHENTFRFLCNVTVNGVSVNSDERLKENIVPIKNSLNSLQQLSGVSYNIKNPLTEGIEKDREIKKSTLFRGENPSEKDRESMTFFEQWEEDQLSKKEPRFGLVAQEVQKIFPELVSEDSEGMFSVDYIGLIPIMIEGMKEQQTMIEKLQDELQLIKDNKADLTLRSSANAGNTNINAPGSYFTGAELYQNTPNPFDERTEIRFSVPNEVSSARLIIHDMSGVQKLQRIVSERGSGSVVISGSELNPGMYLYSLICDGNIVDTKRMILTK